MVNSYYNNKKIVVLFDNASIHKTEQVVEYLTQTKLNVMFSVPLECRFNAAEYTFAFIKQKFYKTIFTKK